MINESEIVEIAKALATQHNTIVVATGKHDIITDGFDTYLLKNGDAKLSKVTATGCLAGAMITAAYSHKENLASIILALSILNISAEMADKDAGMASFKISLLDKISLIDIAEIEERISYEKL